MSSGLGPGWKRPEPKVVLVAERPKLTTSEWEQAGRLLAAGESRQRVALIFDIGLSTLYKKISLISDKE
ncbi:Resolvase domain-containing protein [Escherichia coli]|uniref:Resolvase domain-containing protein n=1 Tax=Escherichia coli TaxID=562 RepID=A0A2X1LQX5_ECOLX|nr:Resolvase domain-containing protein [Escherichia coli]